MGAWVLASAALLCVLPCFLVQADASGNIIVSPKPISPGHESTDSRESTEKNISSSADTSKTTVKPFRPSKRLFEVPVYRPTEPAERRINSEQLYDVLGFQGDDAMLPSTGGYLNNVLVLPPEGLSYNFKQVDAEAGETEADKYPDQGVSATVAVKVQPEVGYQTIEDSQGKHQKEVHYHQHKHLHEHEHKQEHLHKHRQDHAHSHNHEHKHDEKHEHHRQGHHEHNHKSSHHHGHEDSHQHDHQGSHYHAHKDDHKHDHQHDQKHLHKSVHHHGHQHKGEHNHHHKSGHHHEHKHGHSHQGKHEHHHSSKDVHKHQHQHEESHHHKGRSKHHQNHKNKKQQRQIIVRNH